MRHTYHFYFHFICPAEKPIIPHLLRYQWIAVDYYGFTLDSLSERSVDPVAGEAGAFSTFAQLRYYKILSCIIMYMALFQRFGIYFNCMFDFYFVTRF